MFILITATSIYFINTIQNAPSLNIETINKKKASKIYDINDNYILQLSMEDYDNVKYEDLPDVFINALLSCEDVRYFMHEGIDLPRILSAIKNDLLSNSLKEGASTLTQQLIKNMMLTNTKSIERKIHEVYLANKIEKLYGKKEILEFYCNYVCFDGVNHGVLSASYKFFNKSVSELTLPEAALLAGVINAPSAYSPFLNPKNAFSRKNVVLHLMHKHGYISKSQKNQAQQVKIEEIIQPKKPLIDNKVYPYQAYIDVVYKQILEKTGYDPYTMPMEIYTYLDTSIQSQIDEMQENESSLLKFNNDLQQFAATIIHNDSGSIIACFGGRNYKGQKLFNHANDKLIQPASTIKVILDYALAFEHLNYSNQEILMDTPYNYPNSNIEIHNVDHTYLGEISIAEALGYSRNTTAVSTLKKVIDKIGQEEVINYLKDIRLMDNGPFSYSYGLGGFTYGVTTNALAAAYAMIARGGLYIEPLCVKKIKLLDGSNQEINFTPYKKQVLSPQSCYLISDVLKQVMDVNYWSINACKPKDVQVYAKTGTTSFDANMLKKYQFPSNASKDRWLASYTSDFSIVAWSGFDEYIKGQQTYFANGVNQANLVKTFCKEMYSRLAKKNYIIPKCDGLSEVNIVKGTSLLATDQIDDEYIVKALYKSGFEPKEYFKEPLIHDLVQYDYFILNDEINFIFHDTPIKEQYHKIFDIDKVLGGKDIIVDVYENGFFKESIICEQLFTYPLNKSFYHFEIYYKYKKGYFNGDKVTLDFIYN